MPELTAHQKTLLALGLSRGEHIEGNTYKNTLLMSEDAYGLYSTQATGHEALVTMVFMGLIEVADVPGRFRVLSAPGDCELRANVLRKKRKAKEAEEALADME